MSGSSPNKGPAMTDSDRIITLEWYEIEQAAQVGIQRFAEARRMGLPKRGAEPTCTNDIDAAGAEFAVAKYLGKRWLAGVNTFTEADVQPNIEVRHTSTNQNLMIRCDRMHEDRPYVLVRGRMPTFEVVGWIRGADAMREEWRCNPGNLGEIFLVPAEALNTVFPRNGGNQ